MLWAYIVVVSLLLTSAAAAVAVLGLVRSHRQFLRQPESFRCRLRLVRGSMRGVGREWQGQAGWAFWAHDVLLVRLGRWVGTTRVLRVRFPENSVEAAWPAAVSELGTDPVVLRLRLDDGEVVEVAAPAVQRDLLAGPFLVACLPRGSTIARRRPPAD